MSGNRLPFTIVDVPQRSPEWWDARLGRVTSSTAAAVMAKIKSGEAAARRNLRMQLVLERLTGQPQGNDYISPAMQRGIELERDACAAYEALTGNPLRYTGFLQADQLMVGGSPDGYIGDFEGLVEVKCPMDATHYEYLRTGKVPGEYVAQVNHLLWITGAGWCDWMSYSPSFGDVNGKDLSRKLVRIERDEKAIEAYAAEVLRFLGEIEAQCAEVEGMAGGGS